MRQPRVRSRPGEAEAVAYFHHRGTEGSQRLTTASRIGIIPRLYAILVHLKKVLSPPGINPFGLCNLLILKYNL